MFSFYQTGEYIKKRAIVELTLIPKIQLKIDKLNEFKVDNNISKEIEQKEIVIESLKYFYNL